MWNYFKKKENKNRKEERKRKNKIKKQGHQLRTWAGPKGGPEEESACWLVRDLLSVHRERCLWAGECAHGKTIKKIR